MNWKQIYTKRASKDLEAIPKVISQRIVDKIAFYTNQPDPLSFAKRLFNSDLGKYRFRIGEYRAIFDIDREGNLNILLILKIANRRDVYCD